MAVKKKNTGLHDDLDRILDEERSDRPSILSGLNDSARANSAASEKQTGTRKRKARLTSDERRLMHPVQTYLNDEEWTKLKIKLANEKLMQEEFLYQAVMKAIEGK